MALPNESRRAPARDRRPEDAPRLSVVPSVPAPSPASLPEVLADAVLGPQAPPKTRTTEPVPEPADTTAARPPAPAPDQGQGAKPQTPKDVPTETTKETALVAVESRSAAEAERAIKWLGVTFRPPDVWRERQPSLREEWEFVMKGDHLPEGLWRAAARGYAAPAIGVISLLHFLIWVLRSPARHATAWVVVALTVVSAALML
ncbi:hypothetical protein [Nocardiopsis sp. FIRDI 009]|uniref:hypothetical protein n=1 Tax=Nocardiopsis sp. FIRDI 009 TaxID=714197 RepID=UPI000E25B36B|nr:hypothetical protein [Nocardiopsis sp. FIRDI 009]